MTRKISIYNNFKSIVLCINEKSTTFLVFGCKMFICFLQKELVKESSKGTHDESSAMHVLAKNFACQLEKAVTELGQYQ